MQSQEFESFEVPGVGEVRARAGTSTVELAGAVKYWHDKYKDEVESVRVAAFTAGVALTSLFGLIGGAIYWLW